MAPPKEFVLRVALAVKNIVTKNFRNDCLRYMSYKLCIVNNHFGNQRLDQRIAKSAEFT